MHSTGFALKKGGPAVSRKKKKKKKKNHLLEFLCRACFLKKTSLQKNIIAVGRLIPMHPSSSPRKK